MMAQRDVSRGAEDAGQMLLLIAIILAIGFIALASMAARINQIPDEAALTQEGLFFDEVDLVVAAVVTASDQLAEDAGYNLTTSFPGELEDALAHLSLAEFGRGFVVVVGPTGINISGCEVTIPLHIGSVQDEVALTVTRNYSPMSATCV